MKVGASGVSARISLQIKNKLYSTGMVYVYFPRWNPQEGDAAYHYIQSSAPICTSVLNTSPLLGCYYDFDTQTLSVNYPVAATAESGTTLTFDVDSFLNPYSGVPRSGFIITTRDLYGGEVDSSETAGITISIKVTDWTEFSSIAISRVDTMTTVAELSTGKIYFNLDLPLDAGCRIEVVFPTDMPLTTGLTELTSTGVLDANLVTPTYFDTASNTFYLDGCLFYSSYIENTLYMYKMQNKGHVMDTFTFKVYFWAIDSTDGAAYPIAKAESGLYFQASDFTPGTITTLKIDPVETTEVQNHTRYTIQVWPVHYIPQSSMMTFKFPTSINLTEGSCFVQIQVTPMSSSATCSVSANLLTVTYPFGTTRDYTPSSSGLRFVFSSGGNNPLSEKDAGSFEVNTYAIVDYLPYKIDTQIFYNIFTPTRGTVAMRISDITTYITYNFPNTYTFMITPTKKYPEGTKLKIEMPNTITLQGTTVPSCSYTIKGQTYSGTNIETLEVSERPYIQDNEQGQSLGTLLSPRIQFMIHDAFTSRWYLDPGSAFYVMCDGFRNPRTTRETSTFKIHVTDVDGYYIEERMSDVTTQMAIRPDMPQFQVDMSNFTNGDVNTYTVKTYSPLPHFNGDIIFFEFPVETVLPANVICVPIEALTNIECTKIDTHTVKGVMTFQNDFNEVDTIIVFQVLDIQNPPDTRLSSAFSNVQISDPLEYQLTQYIGITTLQTLYFATVQNKALTQTDYGLLKTSMYTITYTAINRMPSGSSFLITYPNTVQAPVSLTTCEILYAGVVYYLYGCAVDLDNGLLSISGGFNVAVAEFTELAITFGPMITPISQLEPGKFTLQSYVGTQYRYLIDEIPEGLIPIFECDHPCRTCELPSRTKCLSCKTNVPTEVLVYLELNQCLSRCPDGKFGNLKNDKICEFCPDQCLTCWDELTCTRCKGNYPLTELYNGWCYPTCPPGLCPINFKCSACNAPPFLQIQVTSNPSTVGLVSAVRLNAALSQTSGKYFETDDILWLLIPSPGVFIVSDDESQQYRATRYKDYFSDITLCQSLTLGITVEYCTIYLSRVMLKLSTSVQYLRSASFLIGNFQNPSTTTPIAGIQTFLTNATDSLKAVYQNTYLSNLTPERIKFAILSTSTDIIGASNVLFTVTFTIKNTFASTNQIWVTFPYWNPRSNNPKHMIATQNPTCQGLLTLNPSLSCFYDPLLRMLKITGASNTVIPSETNVTFTVDNFQNPYNGIEKSGFQIQTMEQTGTGILDQSDILSITVNQFASLEYPSLSRADLISTVGELSSLTFSFRLNLPVDPDCRIRIIFPEDQPLTSDLSTSQGTNMFSSASGLSALDIANNYAEVAGCPTYSERTVAYKDNTVTLGKILNIGWVKDTMPFALEMYAVHNSMNYRIAKVTQDDFIVRAATMLTVGSIYSLAVTAFDTGRAGMFSRYKVTMQPIHGIPSNHKIKVKFPTSGNIITLNGGPCSITQGTGIIVPGDATCSVDTLANEVTIVDAFGPSGTYIKGEPEFSFLFSSGGQNPSKTCGNIYFEVSTFATIGGQDYAIDYKYFDSLVDAPPRFIPFMPEAPHLAATLDQISSLIASYKPTSYTFTIAPDIPLPIGSLLIVKFPRTVRLPYGVSQVYCTATLGVDIYYEYSTPYSLDPLEFKLQNLFSLKEYSQVGTSFTLVCDGIWNPRTLEPTPSIILQTSDSESCAIQSVSSGLNIAMDSLPSFKRVVITNDNIFNGQYSTYTIDVTPSVIFINFDLIYLTFPPELTLPSNPSCQAGHLLQQVICLSPSPNVLMVELTFKTPQLADDYQVQFKVFNVRNPSNTKQTIPFYDIEGRDIKGQVIAVYQSVGPTIKNQLPSLAVGTLKQLDNTLGATTYNEITYTTVNYMPKDSSFLLEYPHTVTIPPEFDICEVTFNQVTYQMKCPIDSEQKTVKIYQGLSLVSIPEGSTIKIKFGPVTNPNTPQSVASFKLTSFTDWYQLYLIDRIPNNLVPQYQCEYPCATCPSQDERSICLSCFTTEVERYLYGTKCLAVCPKGTKPDESYICAGPTIDFDTKLLSISNLQASFEPTKYSIQVLPLKAIPDGSTIQVTFPNEVEIAFGGGYIVCETYAQRTVTQAFNNTGKVTLVSPGPPIVIQIEGLFKSQAVFDIGSKITITCDRLKNPPTITSSGSFSVTISNPIAAPQTVSNGMQVKMTTLATKISFKMEPLNRVTGQLGDYRFTISSGQTLNSGSRIKFDFPSELTLPEAIICSLDSNLLQSIACSQEETCIYKQSQSVANYKAIPNGKVTAVFNFVSSPLPPNTPITFIISQIGNPQSTKPISVVSVKLYDADGTLIPEPTATIPSFSMKIPAEASTNSLVLDDYTKGAKTGFTITYTTMNDMPPQSYIVITYPASAGFQQGVEIACAVTVDSVPFAHICKLDRLKRDISIQLVSGVGQKTQNAVIIRGSVVGISVKDFTNDALYGDLSREVFILKSYTDKTRLSGIDKVTSGLKLFSCEEGFYMGETECLPCLSPCLTCLAPGDKCQSCDQTVFSSGTYLYQDYCYVKMDACPGN